MLKIKRHEWVPFKEAKLSTGKYVVRDSRGNCSLVCVRFNRNKPYCIFGNNIDEVEVANPDAGPLGCNGR